MGQTAFTDYKPTQIGTVFGDQEAARDMAVTVVPFIVAVAHARNDVDGQQPTYDKFVDDDRLQALMIFQGSSSGGPTYAKLRAVTGDPITPQIDVENSPMLLPGDRVIVGMNIRGERVWMFGGYFTSAQLSIDEESESLDYRISGPEWAWGTGGMRAGADAACYGQFRRSAKEDDAWSKGSTTTTPTKGLINCADEPCIFNPGGRGNMTTDDVYLDDGTEDGADPVMGRCWEIPDRKRGTDAKAAKWDKFNAAKSLVFFFNDETRTGISCDWDAAKSVIENAAGGSSKILRETSVDGLGIWEALDKIVGPEIGFYVDCRPSPTPDTSWTGFKLVFYDKSSGDAAKLFLATRGTSIVDAKPDVTRVQAMKDVSKVVNRVVVVGRGIRHLRLKYWGSQTEQQTAEKKATALQHGWSKDDGDLQKFSKQGTVSRETIESSGEANRQEWDARHVTSGTDFAKYRHVFRLFAWNEAGEYAPAGGQPTYGVKQNQTTYGKGYDWYAPDLNHIADADGFIDPDDYKADQYVRRRRKLLDTAYLDGTLDGFRRLPPQLFIGACDADNDTEPTADKYVRVPADKYRIDPERSSVYITEADLSKWTPLKNRKRADADPPADLRNFAELLFTGKLRLILDASIECDLAMIQTAERMATSGAPQVRETIVRSGDSWIQTLDYTDNGVTSPITLAVNTVDESSDAYDYANQLRIAASDEQVHSSIHIDSDSKRPIIGQVIQNIDGRNIKLTSKSGRGSQIVAFVSDLLNMKYEALTESAAAEVRQLDRERLIDRKTKYEIQRRQTYGGRSDRSI